MKIKDELLNLKQTDTYSLILFALYRIKGIPEYSSLSELAYILDKDNLLKLCEYFGGQTITIPTIEEIESLVYCLMLYQYVDVDGMNYDDAIKAVGFESYDLRKVKTDYIQLKSILSKYTFLSRCETDD